MAYYTSAEIQVKKDELAAITAAYNQSIATGGVKEFRQGSTHFIKATTAELKALKDSCLNEIFRMEDC